MITSHSAVLGITELWQSPRLFPKTTDPSGQFPSPHLKIDFHPKLNN